MRQITIRLTDKALQQAVEETARREDISLNKAVVRLLRRGAGLDPEPDDVVGNALDRLFGTWTEEEYQECEEAVRVFEEIDLGGSSIAGGSARTSAAKRWACCGIDVKKGKSARIEPLRKHANSTI